MLSSARRREDTKFEGKIRLTETDNQKHAEVQTKLIRLRVDAGLRSSEGDIKPSDYKEKKENFYWPAAHL
jgi:hypothetical protein